jgi:hypothetical protein
LKHDGVDQFWLKKYPVTLGLEKRLFHKGTIHVAYRLMDSKAKPSGVLDLFHVTPDENQ